MNAHPLNRIWAWIWIPLLLSGALLAPAAATDLSGRIPALFLEAGSASPATHPFEAVRSRSVRVDPPAIAAAIEGRSPLELNVFENVRIVADREQVIRNRSGSVSWIGRVRRDGGRGNEVRDDASGRVVLVTRDGVTLGSIRAGGALYMLYYGGRGADGGHRHAVYQVDETAPAFRELPPTPVDPGPPRRPAPTEGNMDDGSIQDLMVVYTPAALAAVGGVTAMENLIDLGVTESNLSYAASGIDHRLRLVHTALTPFDEMQGIGDPRDLLQDPDDGFMDEVHPLRDLYAADLVKLIVAGIGCGRAFIMDQVSLAFEAFAFCWTGYVCVSPSYSFEHELGHIQGGRHQWSADGVNNAPFTFNHGYADPVAGFRTIMGVNDSTHCPGCTRRLAWANPDVNDPETGAPMGIPEGQPEASDMRKTLNATAWTVANFRVSNDEIFADGFETGDLGGWSSAVP